MSTITFYIQDGPLDPTPYTAEAGMTWGDWAVSDYNNTEWNLFYDSYYDKYFIVNKHATAIIHDDDFDRYAYSTDLIVDGRIYTIFPY